MDPARAVSAVSAVSAGRPWLSVAIAAVALAAATSNAIHDALVFDRALILGSQWWRLWSGHFTHHGWSHLFWNLVVFVPAGVWAERIDSRSTRWLLAIAPMMISIALLMIEPQLTYYAGLSGLSVGVVTLLALLHVRRCGAEPAWIWKAMLVLVAAKIVLEFFRGETTMFSALPTGIRNVPLAHLGGALCALAAFAIGARLQNR